MSTIIIFCLQANTKNDRVERKSDVFTEPNVKNYESDSRDRWGGWHENRYGKNYENIIMKKRQTKYKQGNGTVTNKILGCWWCRNAKKIFSAAGRRTRALEIGTRRWTQAIDHPISGASDPCNWFSLLVGTSQPQETAFFSYCSRSNELNKSDF